MAARRVGRVLEVSGENHGGFVPAIRLPRSVLLTRDINPRIAFAAVPFIVSIFGGQRHKTPHLFGCLG